jgi:uroporphyrinogen-III synthase
MSEDGLSAPPASEPLAGRHIAITRPPSQAGPLAEQLVALGARVTSLPAIRIEPSEDTTVLDDAVRELATYDWLIFTSVNGVAAFAERLMAGGRTWDDRGRARIAAIGPATAEALAAQGVQADLVPQEFVAEALADALGNVAGQRILLPRADIARETLARELLVRGADVTEVAAYHTVVEPIAPELLRTVLEDDRVDAITFTSSSTVRGLAQSLTALLAGDNFGGNADLGVALAGIALVAIGPVTASTLRDYDLEPAIVGEEYTIPGLVRALATYFGALPSARPREGE